MEEELVSTSSHPTPAAQSGTNAGFALQHEQVRSWRENGYALVDRIFPAELIRPLIDRSPAGAERNPAKIWQLQPP
jgi:hypothetical protein